VRFVKKVGDPHFLIVHRVLERRRRVGHLGNEDHEQEDVRNIELPSAAQHLSGGVQRPFFRQAPAVDQGSGEAGNKNEDFRRIEKPERLQGEIAEYVFRYMIDEDKDQRHAAEEIEAEIA